MSAQFAAEAPVKHRRKKVTSPTAECVCGNDGVEVVVGGEGGLGGGGANGDNSRSTPAMSVAVTSSRPPSETACTAVSSSCAGVPYGSKSTASYSCTPSPIGVKQFI